MIPHSIGFFKDIYDNDAIAYIGAAGITDPDQATAIFTLVDDLKTNDIWDDCLAVYPLIGLGATANTFNLIDIHNFNLSFTGTWTHSLTGANTNGAGGSFANTHIKSYEDCGSGNQHMSVWLNTGDSVGSIMGCLDVDTPDTRSEIWIGGTEYGEYRVASQSTLPLIINVGDTGAVDFRGFYCVSRVGGSSTQVSGQKGSSIISGTCAYQLCDLDSLITIGGLNNDGKLSPTNVLYQTNNQMQFISIGKTLTAAKMGLLNTIVDDYQTNLSRHF